ncbi:rubredoxin [Mucilaginibacter sp. CSA2-8R]|uniref:rubredoxin n=1 Tax=Mucilaginibacter sp. CSA2-8R TaxID=3141542 RepID=UPI00315CD09B
MSTQHVIKINLPGGYVSAGDLYEMLVIAEEAGAVDVRFGNRQQLYFTVDAAMLESLETDMLRAGTDYELDADEYPNIISSYVCDSVFSQDSWLREGVYRDIFDLFNYKPCLKINVVDRHQTFVPFFSGNFNFISSEVSNYWYWHIRFPKTSKFYCWPALIYSEDIPLVSQLAEKLIQQHKGLFYDKPYADEQLFYQMLSKHLDVSTQPIAEPLQLPEFYLPYYEGFNQYTNKYWLGIYRRNELFDISFLKEACSLCIQSRIGQLYTTPWKSLIIKGIETVQRADWGLLLDKYRLNIRHASNELNWQVEDLSAEGLALKRQLVREFEEADLRTYRMSFVIKTRPKTGLMGSVIIKAHPSGTFELLHTLNFNPNSKDYTSHKKKVKRNVLTAELIKLCDIFYDVALNSKSNVAAAQDDQEFDTGLTSDIYSCRHCKTYYDPHYGDEFNNIPAGTRFDQITDAYICSVCSATKSSFMKIEF